MIYLNSGKLSTDKVLLNKICMLPNAILKFVLRGDITNPKYKHSVKIQLKLTMQDQNKSQFCHIVRVCRSIDDLCQLTPNPLIFVMDLLQCNGQITLSSLILVLYESLAERPCNSRLLSEIAHIFHFEV